jgi:hypothetical protein
VRHPQVLAPEEQRVALPAIAAGMSVTISSGRLRSPRAANSPAVMSSESPGRKKPNSNPVSAKMMIGRPN